MSTHPKRIWLTALHLLALGIIGTMILSILFSILVTGIATIPILGIGFLFLIGFVYTLYGVAWLEVERVSGLYLLDVPRLPFHRQASPGLGAYLRSLGTQFADGRMWRAIGNLVIGTIIGFGALTWVSSSADLAGFLGRSVGIGGPAVEVLVATLLAAGGIVGLSFLYRIISIAIITAGAKEAQLREQREGAVRAADVERTRIERDLHDGVQPRLVSVAMTLGLAQQHIDDDPETAKALVAEAHTSIKSAITELRQLARGIYASVLDDRGLDAALSAVAARSHVPVHLDVRVDGRCSRDAEAAIYFAIAESLTNAAKHSRSSECRVVVRQRDDTLWARVEDNGIGGATVIPGGGLDGIHNRVIAAGGTITLNSPQGGPTSLEVSVPCAS